MRKLFMIGMICVIATAFCLNATVLQAEKITTFEDGNPDVTITFSGTTWDRSTKLSIPNNSTTKRQTTNPIYSC